MRVIFDSYVEKFHQILWLLSKFLISVLHISNHKVFFPNLISYKNDLICYLIAWLSTHLIQKIIELLFMCQLFHEHLFSLLRQQTPVRWQIVRQLIATIDPYRFLRKYVLYHQWIFSRHISTQHLLKIILYFKVKCL